MKILVKSPAKLTNKDGKARRTIAKRVLIGNIYGRGAKSIAEQTGQTVEEAKATIDNFFKSFPITKQWMEECRQFSHKTGITKDMFGRQRHLDNILLPHYSFKYIVEPSEDNLDKQYKNCKSPSPFLTGSDNALSPELEQKYSETFLASTGWKTTNNLTADLKKEGIEVTNNVGDIAQGERQAVNFKCQSSGASLIKRDMIAIANNEQLQKLGFELLLTIHDEIVGQCPKENAEAVKVIINDIMTHIGDDILNVPMVCDTNDEPSMHWYMSEEETAINYMFTKLKEQNISDEDAYKQVCEQHKELLPENIYNNLFKGEYLR